jgi:hypothetical protein
MQRISGRSARLLRWHGQCTRSAHWQRCLRYTSSQHTETVRQRKPKPGLGSPYVVAGPRWPLGLGECASQLPKVCRGTRNMHLRRLQTARKLNFVSVSVFYWLGRHAGIMHCSCCTCYSSSWLYTCSTGRFAHAWSVSVSV